MKMKFVINAQDSEERPAMILDSSSTLSSWLIDHYFTKIYSNEIRTSSKSVEPKNIIALHDMFIIGQLIESELSLKEFLSFCQMKLKKLSSNDFLSRYDSYLKRCGLTDLIDLWHLSQIDSTFSSLTFTEDHVKNDFDRLIFDHLVEICSSEEKLKKRESSPDETLSKNYIRHTFIMYFSLLLDSRNEHALVHCLITPTRQGIERRTIVELRRLSQLAKNEALTMYQILLSFLRRKEFHSTRTMSSNTEDETFLVLDKYSVGLKEFLDFLEQLQMKIEENEHLNIESNRTFHQLLLMISKQLRKDHSFHRCETMIKEVIEEFSTAFRNPSSLIDCSSPKRSASSGGTLAGRRFRRSLAYFTAKQFNALPVFISKTDHYESPSTGLKKATSSRLLRSPLTPLPIVIEEKIEEAKPVEIPVESVFQWKKEFSRRKSQRCLDLSSSEVCSNDSIDEEKSTKKTSRPALVAIDFNALDDDLRANETSHQTQRDADKENVSTMAKKRSIASTIAADPPRKKQKKVNAKPLPQGQKSITNFFSLNK